MSRRPQSGLPLAFLAAPPLASADRRPPSAVRAFWGGFLLAWVLAIIVLGGLW